MLGMTGGGNGVGWGSGVKPDVTEVRAGLKTGHYTGKEDRGKTQGLKRDPSLRRLRPG